MPTDGPVDPAGGPEVQLDPALQARLLERMREEQAAAVRAAQLRRHVVFPAIGLVTLIGVVMSFSDDPTRAVVGNVLASSILYVFWKLRGRIAGALGF